MKCSLKGTKTAARPLEWPGSSMSQALYIRWTSPMHQEWGHPQSISLAECCPQQSPVCHQWNPVYHFGLNQCSLNFAAAGLQGLLDSMHGFWLGLGLTISPSKTEVVVFNGSSPDTWHVGRHVLPWSASFKYLGICLS